MHFYLKEAIKETRTRNSKQNQANLDSLKATKSKSLIKDSSQTREENSNMRDNEETKQEDEIIDMNVDKEQPRRNQMKLTDLGFQRK